MQGPASMLYVSRVCVAIILVHVYYITLHYYGILQLALYPHSSESCECKCAICTSGRKGNTASASGVFVPKAEGETVPSYVAASDNHRKHKVQRSECNVQRSGPASVQVRAGCHNNVQL